MSTTWINRGHFYVPHVRPVLLDCNFIVDHTNGNGFGIRALKGQGIASLFMNTSVTPGRAANGQLNPNPAAGLIQVQFSDNFNRYYGGTAGFVSPLGSSTTSSVANVINVITSLGTATLAQWLAVGLKPGVTPTLGASFIATSSAVIGGSATTAIILAAGAGIDHIEVGGDPNTTIGPVPVGGSPNVGGFIYLSCYKNTVLTAPTDGTGIGLQFYMSQSNVMVKGE